jgi:hypothetical protein
LESKAKIKKNALKKIEEIYEIIKNDEEIPSKYSIHLDSENIDLNFFEEYYKKEHLMFINNEQNNNIFVRSCNDIEKIEYYHDEYPFLKLRKSFKLNYL